MQYVVGVEVNDVEILCEAIYSYRGVKYRPLSYNIGKPILGASLRGRPVSVWFLEEVCKAVLSYMLTTS